MEMEGCQRLSHLVPTPQWRGRAFAPPCACGVQGRLLEGRISPAEEPAWRRPAPGKLHRLHPTPLDPWQFELQILVMHRHYVADQGSERLRPPVACPWRCRQHRVADGLNKAFGVHSARLASFPDGLLPTTAIINSEILEHPNRCHGGGSNFSHLAIRADFHETSFHNDIARFAFQ